MIETFSSIIKKLEDEIKDKELGRKQYERDSQINLANACFNDIKELEINLKLAKQLKEIVKKAIDDYYDDKYGRTDMKIFDVEVREELRKALGVNDDK